MNISKYTTQWTLYELQNEIFCILLYKIIGIVEQLPVHFVTLHDILNTSTGFLISWTQTEKHEMEIKCNLPTLSSGSVYENEGNKKYNLTKVNKYCN